MEDCIGSVNEKVNRHFQLSFVTIILKAKVLSLGMYSKQGFALKGNFDKSNVVKDEVWFWIEKFKRSKYACSTNLFSLLFSFLIGKYGNYIIDRFNLTERYPRFSNILNLRLRLQKYYFTYNMVLIFLNIIFILFFNLYLLFF